MKNITPIQLAQKLSMQVLNEGSGASRELNGIYCCDLLSLVMGRAKENDAWITVMCNINTIAVAVLTDASCIVISEGLTLDEQALSKAVEEDVCVLLSGLPTFETAQKINEAIFSS